MGTRTTAMITRTKDDRADLHSLLRHHVVKRGFGLGRRLRRQLSAMPNLYAAPLVTSTFAFQQLVVCCGLHLRRSLAVAQQLCSLHRSVLHTQPSGRESTPGRSGPALGQPRRMMLGQVSTNYTLAAVLHGHRAIPDAGA